MPRFPVNFRRKSTTAEDSNTAPAGPSFRVLERPDSGAGKSFEHAPRMGNGKIANASVAELSMEDNIFAGLKNNRSSGGSNTTKTASDNSSRHSNASTTPSSTDNGVPADDGRVPGRKPVPVHLSDSQAPPRNSGGFLRNAGRTFSFGSSKKSSLPPIPAEEPVPRIPSEYAGSPSTPVGRARAETASTITTATPPQVEDRDFMLDLGGDLSTMLSKFDKRSSIMSLKDRNFLGGRGKQPSPLHLDKGVAVEPPPKSWNSQTSHDGLLGSGRLTSPRNIDSMAPPPVPKHTIGRAAERAEAEDTFMEDSLAARQYLSSASARPRTQPQESYKPEFEANDENMFATSSGRQNKPASRLPRSFTQPQMPTQSKVMTNEQFEKYRQDKVRQERMGVADKDESDKEDDENYDDDEDEAERSAQAAKQRRKQEAHMAVYRQQMMKVTGDNAASGPRPSIQMSMSTPNLALGVNTTAPPAVTPTSDGSESDEEVPLAILAAHGFPNKNRPPTRLTTVGSNPNLRASVAPSYSVGGGGPGSVVGESGPKGPLPPFARKLPQDPYLGAGLINQPPRESFALGGGAPLREQQPRALPVGGLVGVIANEERSRAMRRGSPAAMDHKNMMPNALGFGGGMGGNMNGGFDPMGGIPPQMMYPMGGMGQMQPPMLTPGDQAQIQMTQQMQQFMQMQMQFMQMQMMSNQNPGQAVGNMPQQRPLSHMPRQSFSGSTMDIQRQSFLDPPRGDAQMRTMSMVQPSSASWIQPPQPGYAPSIRLQGGYTPSIAPSERSNVGLPGRYRPVSHMPPAERTERTSTMSGALSSLPQHPMRDNTPSPLAGKTGADNDDDDDDEQGWEAMKQKREKKKGLWRNKKSFGAEISALIS
ncbi:uncharacterized protein B0I36DRAFT_360370 [Microdochium trichocladiopsis]|uniref:Uncharacterized protein n=1 Tax=Microdochium trichocladiopsis TaxID=1682393 RepID=A0A9P8Y8H2_9PEZI|nr:uncharacterized protein B0I36DRAFT_360370 [Microdochium trichocladiopsis]KAH7034909.1 hypothetical protein B0I36DRAFT_360370 [Microdochium trichocladiopsis]